MFKRIIITFASVAMFSGVAFAEVPKDIADYIEANTVYKTNEYIDPVVEYVSTEVLCDSYARKTENTDCNELIGTYFQGKILLKEGLDFENDVINRSFKIHEYVHAYQDYYGKLTDYNKADLEAYSVQGNYLREKGFDREAALLFIASSFSVMPPESYTMQ